MVLVAIISPAHFSDLFFSHTIENQLRTDRSTKKRTCLVFVYFEPPMPLAKTYRYLGRRLTFGRAGGTPAVRHLRCALNVSRASRLLSEEQPVTSCSLLGQGRSDEIMFAGLFSAGLLSRPSRIKSSPAQKTLAL